MSETGLTLDVGSGHDEIADVNFDISRLDAVDIQGDMHSMPFADDTFTQIHLRHVLEHSEDVIQVIEEIHRVARDGAIVNLVVPHGLTVRGIRDPTHYQQFSVRTIEHFCVGCSYLPSWYSDASFELETGKIVAGRPNEIEPAGPVRKVLQSIGYGANKAIVRLANAFPELCEPFVVLTSRADLKWRLRVVKERD